MRWNGPAEEAFGSEAAEILRGRILEAARRACPPRLASQLEDIVQTVLIRLVAPRPGGEGNRAFSSTYLARAAYGATVDEIRRVCRRREDPLRDPALLDRVAGTRAGPEREAASAEIGRGIQDCLAKLVRPRRLAVTLYLEGCTVPEVAALLEWSVKKAENLVYRGLADLRGCLTRKGLEP